MKIKNFNLADSSSCMRPDNRNKEEEEPTSELLNMIIPYVIIKFIEYLFKELDEDLGS